jgi:hemolysin III
MVQEGDAWFDMRLSDGGPVYTETDLSQFIVEPWNAISSLLYMLPALYWLYRIGGNQKDFKFLVYASVLVITGSLGSTLYHAFRASSLFLIMDVLPVAILALSLSIFFWIKVFNSWKYMLLVVVPLTALRFVLFSTLPDNLAINLSYALTGIIVMLPIIILHFQNRIVYLKYMLYMLLAFALALLFREMDSWHMQLLPMGTHFLWHAFTGMGTYFLLAFLYRNQIQKKHMV